MEFGGLPGPLPSKQSSWDRPGVLLDKALVESSLSSATQRATSLAALAAHSGDCMAVRQADHFVRSSIGR